MKKTLMVLLLLMAAIEGGYSQNVNWRSLGEDQQNIVQFNFGYDFGVTAQVGYYRTFTFIKPVAVGLDYSLPMGRNLLDDFKIRLGGQVEIIEIGGFSTTVKILSNFRRYQNDLVTVASFGSDFAVVTGYYAPSWYAAGEFGFDKSITTNLKHSTIMRTYVFPGVRDGWYLPSGGNFYFGIQAGKTLGEVLELSLRLGATRGEAGDEDAVVPLYLQLGLGVRF